MDKLRDYFTRWNMAFADMVLALSLFSFLQIGKEVVFSSLIPFVLSFSLVVLVDMFMVEKEASLITYVLTNGALALACGALQIPFLRMEDIGIGTMVFYAAICLIPYAHAAISTMDKVERRTIINYFDFLVILEVLFIATLGTQMSLPSVLAILGLVSILGMQAVLVLMRLRTNDQGSKVKRIAGAFAMAATIGAVCGLSFLLSRGFGVASVAFVNGLSWLIQTGLNLLLAALEAFFAWLLALLPDSDRFELPEVDEGINFDPRVSEVSEGNPIYFLIIVGLLALGVIIFFLAKLRGKRLKKGAGPGKAAKRRRKSRISMGLGRLWRKLVVEVRYLFSYMTHRQSVSGLFVWTQGFYTRRGAGRKKNETPGVYLRRIAATVAPEKARAGMVLLSGKLDEEYYGGRKTTLPSSFASTYRKANRELKLTLREYFEIRKKQRLLQL